MTLAPGPTSHAASTAPRADMEGGTSALDAVSTPHSRSTDDVAVAQYGHLGGARILNAAQTSHCDQGGAREASQGGQKDGRGDVVFSHVNNPVNLSMLRREQRKSISSGCQALSTGRGLGWTREETFSITTVAPLCCSDLARGNDMKRTKLNRLIRSKFIRHVLRPEFTCTGVKDGGRLDPRSWDGRSERAVGNHWDHLKSECQKFYETLQLVEKEDITGNPKEKQLHRCAVADFNARTDEYGVSSVVLHFVDICRNPHYRIGRPFPYTQALVHISKFTDLISAQSATVYAQEEGESLPEENNSSIPENIHPTSTDDTGNHSPIPIP